MNNILITINNLNDIEELKKLGINNYVFPIKDFSVGYPNTFLVADIKIDAYILINRILDNEGIDKFKELMNNIPKNIKGIIFDDLGILKVIKDKDIEKILYLNHFNTNSESINEYLEYVDTLIVATDITKEEIEYIIKKANKKISLFTFGYTQVMYSRRKLIDNYSKFHQIEYQNPIVIDNTDHKFLVYENEYGTVFYANNIYDGRELLELDTLYNFINAPFINLETIKKFLNKEEIENSDKGFLYTETIYKLKGDENV